MVSFEHPEHFIWLWALLPLAGLTIFLILFRRRTLRLLRWKSSFALIQPLLWLSGWILLLIAWSGPSGPPHQVHRTESVERQQSEVLFVLDTSESMLVSDTRTGASRLDFAKEIIDQMITKREGEAVSLWAFTSEVVRLIPATYDYLYTRLFLRQVGVNEPDVAGTSFYALFDHLRHRFQEDHEGVIVLLTDGGETQLAESSAEEKRVHIEAMRSLVSSLHRKLFVIGLGSKEGGVVPGALWKGERVWSQLDEELLCSLAQAGGGSYFHANDFSSLNLAKEVDRVATTREIEVVELERPSYSPFVLLGAFMFLSSSMIFSRWRCPAALRSTGEVQG